MKAYGLAVLLRNELGLRTEVLVKDESEADHLRVISSLTATQLNELQAIAEMHKWEVAHKGRPDEVDPYLAVVPKSERG
jgi:hypothetical protein